MAVLEISDLITDWDPVTRMRRPVAVDDAVRRLRQAGEHRAARIVQRMPAPGGVLDEAAVDRLLVRVHTELQRLGEELHMVERFVELLAPIVVAARAQGLTGRVHIVDIGCGIGYVVRALAAGRVLGEDVELIGVDFNAALVAEARRLADDEGLRCEFVCGDAFELAEEATIYISSGVMHHFPAESLPEFFKAQDRPGTAAFVHYDIAATRLAPVGAWLFHRARMREQLGRHDGVASARRAHDDLTLLDAARQATGMDVFLFEPTRHTNPFCAAMRPVVGIRRELVPGVRAAFGRRARGLR